MNFNHNSGKCITIDSANIYVEEFGDPKQQALVFLHGGFGNMEDFNGLIPLLQNDYRIIGIDSRGQGKSTLGNTELTYARIEMDLLTVIEKLKIVNPIIIGFSDGGIAALRLASSSVFKIHKLIIMGASWHTKSLENSKVFLKAITAEKWKVRFPETYRSYQKLNPEANFDMLTAAIVSMWVDEEPSGHPDDHVQNIDCPTLIVRGDNDHLVSKESAFELSQIIQNSHLANIPFSGHEVYVDQKIVLMELINHFLNE